MNNMTGNADKQVSKLPIVGSIYFVVSALGMIVFILVIPSDIMQNNDIFGFVKYVGRHVSRVHHAEYLRVAKVSLEIIPLFYAVGYVWALTTGPLFAIYGFLFEKQNDISLIDWRSPNEAAFNNVVLFPFCLLILYWVIVSLTGSYRLTGYSFTNFLLYGNYLIPIILNLCFIMIFYEGTLIVLRLPGIVIFWRKAK